MNFFPANVSLVDISAYSRLGSRPAEIFSALELGLPALIQPIALNTTASKNIETDLDCALKNFWVPVKNLTPSDDELKIMWLLPTEEYLPIISEFSRHTLPELTSISQQVKHLGGGSTLVALQEALTLFSQSTQLVLWVLAFDVNPQNQVNILSFCFSKQKSEALDRWKLYSLPVSDLVEGLAEKLEGQHGELQFVFAQSMSGDLREQWEIKGRSYWPAASDGLFQSAGAQQRILPDLAGDLGRAAVPMALAYAIGYLECSLWSSKRTAIVIENVNNHFHTLILS